ncbi:hypothetical protein ACHQM5_027196 [Ranunculus cassubicifolius]
MDKLGERLKTSGAQMTRMVSNLLQSQTQESKMVDEATSETLDSPNWGMNLRICGLLNSEEFSGQEIAKAIKKKISGSKNEVVQRLSLELLEVCAMNCEKVFSEIASEKVLDEIVKMIDNPVTVSENRIRGFQLIRAWGESEDLGYLPVFRQTYQSLKAKGAILDQQAVSPPANYPVTDTGYSGFDELDDHTVIFNNQRLSSDEKKEIVMTTRNSIELLSSILNTEQPASAEDDLTLSMVEKCKESQPLIQRIIETTNNDEAMLFEALSLNDELQQVIAKYEEIQAVVTAKGKSHESSATAGRISPVEEGERVDEKAKADTGKGESTEADSYEKSFTIQESLAIDSEKKNANVN